MPLDPKASEQHDSTASAWQAGFALCLLLMLYILAYVDRQVLAYMVAPIQAEFGLGDTGVSLLLGLAFACTYTVVAFPVARLADRGSRRNIILGGALIWSLATALCGLTRSMGQLFVARMLVGFGEAFLNPAAVSFLSDRFSSLMRGRVMSIYMLALPLGNGLANMLGGQVLAVLATDTRVSVPLLGAMTLPPWRLLLMLLGISGVLMALLMFLVREPPRRETAPLRSADPDEQPTLTQVGRFAWQNRWVMAGITLPLTVSAFLVLGVGYWLPSYFLRSFGLSPGEAGHYLYYWGVISLVAGVAGVLLGGWLADWSRRRWSSGLWWVLMLGVLLVGPAYLMLGLAGSPFMALLVLVPATLGNGILQASGVTTLMSVAPNRMRSLLAAAMFFTVNMVGAGIGPTAIALVTEFLLGAAERLQYAIFLLTAALLGLSLYAQCRGWQGYRALMAPATDSLMASDDLRQSPHH